MAYLNLTVIYFLQAASLVKIAEIMEDHLLSPLLVKVYPV